MGRNVGEALGVRSRINLLGYPGRQFQNTIHVDNLHEIELLLADQQRGQAFGRRSGRKTSWEKSIAALQPQREALQRIVLALPPVAYAF